MSYIEIKMKAPACIVTDSLKDYLSQQKQAMEQAVAVHLMIHEVCQSSNVDYHKTLAALDPEYDLPGLIDGSITRTNLEAFIESRLECRDLQKEVA